MQNQQGVLSLIYHIYTDLCLPQIPQDQVFRLCHSPFHVDQTSFLFLYHHLIRQNHCQHIMHTYHKHKVHLYPTARLRLYPPHPGLTRICLLLLPMFCLHCIHIPARPLLRRQVRLRHCPDYFYQDAVQKLLSR